MVDGRLFPAGRTRLLQMAVAVLRSFELPIPKAARSSACCAPTLSIASWTRTRSRLTQWCQMPTEMRWDEG
jgi:hypothetical protein